MPEFITEFVGYDADGDKVWTAPDNRLFAAADRQAAEELLSIRCHSYLGHRHEQYIADYGPITKEKPDA